jgi:hypothetical protein
VETLLQSLRHYAARVAQASGSHADWVLTLAVGIGGNASSSRLAASELIDPIVALRYE